MRGDDLVVEDRDVGHWGDPAPAMYERDCALRQPARGLALPSELDRRRADDDRGIRVVSLERRQRLDRLAEPLLIGQECPPGVERVPDPGPLVRGEFAA